MASKTTLNWASYLFSSAASLRASSVFERSISRKRTNVRMMAMLTWTARELRRTLESIATPCSVKAIGVAPPNFPRVGITVRDTRFLISASASDRFGHADHRRQAACFLPQGAVDGSNEF